MYTFLEIFMKYSLLLPIYNEEKSIPQLASEILKSLKNKDYEIIAINDGSTDTSGQVLASLQKNWRLLKVIKLSSHQGKWAALRAGIIASKGEIIITLDSDLQDDPSELKKLLRRFNEGYDLVSGYRRERIDPVYKVFISRMGNNLLSFLGGIRFRDINSSMKVYKRKVVEMIPKEGSLLRFSLLFAHKMGFRTGEVEIKHRPRKYGNSKFGVIKYIRIIYDLILISLLFSGSGRLNKQK